MSHHRGKRSTKITNEISLEELFSEKMVILIDQIIASITVRFESNLLKFLNCFRVFDPSKVTDEQQYVVDDVNKIKQQYPNDFNDDLLAEWVVFRKYLFAQK